MKRIKKMFIIIALSLYLTAVITPEKEEKVEAAAITATLVLGALAMVGAGGVIAYNSSPALQQIGNNVMNKLTEQGHNVSEMFAQNRFGINKNLMDALADSIAETQSLYSEKRQHFPTAMVYKTDIVEFDIKPDLLKWYGDHLIIFNHRAESEESLNDLEYNLTNSLKNFSPLTGSYNRWGFTLSRTNEQTINRYYHTNNTVNQDKVLRFMASSSTPGPIYVSAEILQYDSEVERDVMLGIIGLPELASGDTATNYRELVSNNYANLKLNEVSIDYEELGNVITGNSDQSISLNNIETIITNLEKDIDEGFEEQKSLSMRILTKVQALPALIAEVGTNTLGGISSLTDDVITGLGNFTDRITAANDRLWEDAGAIWSGMGETLSNVGENVKTFGQSIVGSIENGIDNIRDYTADMKESIGQGIDRVWTGITDLGDRIGTIGGDIVTGLVSVVVPSESAMEEVGEKADRLRNTFSQKLEFITVPIKSISGLFLHPKSLYDVTFAMQGVEVHVLPESFRSSVNVLKPVLNGVLVLLTFFGIYKKIQGKEVI